MKLEEVKQSNARIKELIANASAHAISSQEGQKAFNKFESEFTAYIKKLKPALEKRDKDVSSNDIQKAFRDAEKEVTVFCSNYQNKNYSTFKFSQYAYAIDFGKLIASIYQLLRLVDAKWKKMGDRAA